jgi:hypothetical protein
MSIILNRFDAATVKKDGYVINFQLMCGECFVSITKPNDDGITYSFYKSGFYTNLRVASFFANRVISEQLGGQ